MSQTDRILWHLRTVGPITPVDAVVLYGCTRLSARIHDLRQRGQEIRSRPVQLTNRYGEDVSYNEYYLPGEEPE